MQFSRLNPAIRLVRGGRNRRKGAAVGLGVGNARGALVMHADADGASRMDHLDRLVEAIAKGADVAIGSRNIAESDAQVARRWYRHLIGRVFNLMANTLAALGIQDTQCGFNLFRGEAGVVPLSVES